MSLKYLVDASFPLLPSTGRLGEGKVLAVDVKLSISFPLFPFSCCPKYFTTETEVGVDIKQRTQNKTKMNVDIHVGRQKDR